MNKKIMGALLVSMAATAVFAEVDAPAASANTTVKAAMACQNNSCKGKADCKTFGNANCAGKNECKGHGHLKAKTEAACKKAKGVWATKA